MNIPKTLAAGDSFTWNDEATVDNLGNALSAPTWTLKYALRGATVLDVTATTNGTGWTSTITAAQSGAFTAGIYFWQAYVTSGSVRHTLGTGQIKITPNVYAATAPFEGRSQAEQDLVAVDAAIRAIIAGGGVAEYTIGNRSLRKMPMSDLLVLRDSLRADVRNEKAAANVAQGLSSGKTIKVRFT